MTERERQRRRQEGPKAATAHSDQRDQEQVIPTGEQVIKAAPKRVRRLTLGRQTEVERGAASTHALDARTVSVELDQQGPLVVALLIDGELLNRFRATPLSR